VSFIDLDEKPLVQATLDELRSKNYSLNYKQYLPQNSVRVEGFEMVKLEDIVSFKAEKSKKDKNSYMYIDIGSVDRGNFKAGDTIAKADLPGRAQYSVKVGDILLGTVRPNLEHYLLISPQIYKDDLIVSNGFSIMRCNTDKVLPTYLYSILTLPTTTSYLTERATGTTYPVVDDAIIGAMEIPLPSLERQQQIVEAIDGWAGLAQQEEVALKILEKQMMFQVKEMGRGQARVKLSEVSEIRNGKALTKEDLIGGDVPVIGGGISPMGYHNIHNKEAYTVVLAQIGANAGNVSRYPVKSWITNNGMTIHPKATHIMNDDLLYYVLKNIQDEIKGFAEGTAQPKLSSASVLSLEVQLPPLTEQQVLQSDFDEIRHKHAKIAIYKAKAQEAILRLIPGAV
jgi:restriction endonuclease S subunit